MTTTIHTTMLDVVQAVDEYAASDAEVVATVASLVHNQTRYLDSNCL
jgi:hypothetical protein